MPSIAKHRRVNRSKVLVKKTQRFGGNSKIKPFNPLCGKLKSNNNLLAKALSIQKQENQLLFSEKVQLTSQLQALKLACNRRDMVLTNIQNNAKEMLSMLVTMTNHVTNTIMRCQEFSHKGDGTLQSNAQSAMRRDSTRRLSVKSPARGVVKPMVSGHAITKPTINLRRVNLQRMNNLIDLSVIEEQSPERINNSTINSGRVHTTAFPSTNRLGYEGERRRRLPERIPVEYVGADDDEGGILGSQETRLSERRSGRHSGSHERKRSVNTLVNPIQSPSVALCDVSKLLQNSQTINIRMLQDLQCHEASNELSNTSPDALQRDDNGLTASFNCALEKPQKSCTNSGQKILSPQNCEKSSSDESDTTINETNNRSQVDDPMEGPSWLLNESAVDSSYSNTETVKVSKQNSTERGLNSSDFETEVEKSMNDSMEFTECINTRREPLEILRTVSVPNRNGVDSKIINHVQIEMNENTGLNTIDSDDSSNESEDTADRCTNLAINGSSEFVTDRRQNFRVDEDDEDTIMLQLTKPKQAIMKFNINDFRLPVLNSPILVPVELNDSVPEVTTTLQRIPQNNEPPNLYDDNSGGRVSNQHSMQLPNIDDAPETKKKKHLTKKKMYKNIRFYGSESSDSDYMPDSPKNTTRGSKNAKDPSSAKVVLEKLTNTRMKTKSTNSDQNSLGEIPNPRATDQTTFDPDNLVRTNDSTSSINSINGTCRPRRQKAPVNLKEPNLTKKLRRKE